MNMKTRILIVEDDPDIAELVARYLDKAGFTTEHAGSGRDALQAVSARPPDLIVLDLLDRFGLVPVRLVGREHVLEQFRTAFQFVGERLKITVEPFLSRNQSKGHKRAIVTDMLHRHMICGEWHREH